MKKLPYHVIYDEDAWNFYTRVQEPVPEDVDRLVDHAVNGGTDLYLECACYHRTSYPSRVWETMWDEFRATGNSSGIPLSVARSSGHLADQGCDFLARALKRCRTRGVAGGATVRMDDYHYRGDTQAIYCTKPHLAAFYKNEDLYLSVRKSGMPFRGIGRVAESWALDYERQEVREHYLVLIDELIEGYDLDVISLDFLRHPPFFDRDQLEMHARTMTSFLGEVRARCDRSGRAISIMARVPSTPANCLGLGLDVAAWARSGCIDGIAVGFAWNRPIEKFRRLVGLDVAIYAATERCATYTPYVPVPWTREMFRGYAAAQYATGGDGVYLFNFFLGNLKLADVLAEMSDPGRLAAKPKIYHMSVSRGSLGSMRPETAIPTQAPVDLPALTSRAFEMTLAADTACRQAELLVGTDRPVTPNRCWMQFNDRPLGCASNVFEKGSEEASKTDPVPLWPWTVTFTLPVETVKDGLNEIVLRNETDSIHPITVLGMRIDLR